MIVPTKHFTYSRCEQNVINVNADHRFRFQRFREFHCGSPSLHSSCNLQTGGRDLHNANWVVRPTFLRSTLYSDNVAVFPPEESWSSLMGFWLFAETMCCCAEGCKVNLRVFEVGVVPHWLSLSSLIALFNSSCFCSLTPRVSCTLTHTSALWTVTKAFLGLTLYFFFFFFFPLDLFELC